jgi:NADH-quinone oxidoreductase subunit G
MRDVLNAPAILLIGNDPTNQHPLLAWQIRTNVRLRQARLYVINSLPIKLQRQAAAFGMIPAGAEAKAVAFLAGDDSLLNQLAGDGATRDSWVALREKIRGEQNMVIAFGSGLRGHDVEQLASFASGLTGAKLICLGDYANSRGASEMTLSRSAARIRTALGHGQISDGVGRAANGKGSEYARNDGSGAGWQTEGTLRGRSKSRRSSAH